MLKKLLLILTISLCFVYKNSWSLNKNNPETTVKIIKSYDSFSLSYMRIGLGFNRWDPVPTLSVKGLNYLYTYNQDLWDSIHFGDTVLTRKTLLDTICSGEIRLQSIDSIINIVNEIYNASIHKSSEEMSGALWILEIKTNKKKLKFSLRNDSHPSAQKIIDILNSNLPFDKRELYLYQPPKLMDFDK